MVANESVEVWPENWPAFDLFLRMQTQWRDGMNGRTGLDYMVLFRFLDDIGLAGEDREQMMSDIQTLEIAALNEMHKKQE